MNRPIRTNRVATAVLLSVSLAAFASCSDDGDDAAGTSTPTTTSTATESTSATPEATEPSTSSATTTVPPATTTPAVVQDVTDSPRTTDYVGARDEVSGIVCVRDGDVWRVSGTVTNPTDAAADYRIFIAFLDVTNDTRGLLQTDITGVAASESKDWSGELALDADDLTCGLRVERTGINGAPPPSEPVTT